MMWKSHTIYILTSKHQFFHVYSLIYKKIIWHRAILNWLTHHKSFRYVLISFQCHLWLWNPHHDVYFEKACTKKCFKYSPTSFQVKPLLNVTLNTTNYISTSNINQIINNEILTWFITISLCFLVYSNDI